MNWAVIAQGWLASLPGWAVVITVAFMNTAKARAELKMHLDKVSDEQTKTLVRATAKLTDDQTQQLTEIVTGDGQSRTT